jgi:hypothetical protein
MISMLAALALAGQPAAAPPDEAMARLDGLMPGTSAARVAALFPEGPRVRHRPDLIEIDEVAVTPGCEADAEVRLAGGEVRAIELRGEGALLGRCGGAVREALVARFGAPDRQGRRGETPWRRSRETYEWRRDGRSVHYVRYTSAGYAGSGLASASWVLTVASD